MLSIAVPVDTLQAKDYFNPAALELQGPAMNRTDLDTFSAGGAQAPGTYLVDLYVNDNPVDSRQVVFRKVNDALVPQLSPAQLKQLGVRLEAFPSLMRLPSDEPVSDFTAYIPDASFRFDFSRQHLYLSIPQAAMSTEAQDYVDPSLWDQGMPAAMVNYSFSGANHLISRQNSAADDSYYLNLRTGLNLGAWRLRNYSTYTENDGKRSWNTASTYLQRDVQSLKSQFTLGDSATSGDVFESIQFRGAQLASDDNMYPDSMKGFAPVIRGIAQSNAQVTVRQNGYVIYQTYVPPGAFTIADLYPTASSGDLEVTIKEADGKERRFIQPFSAVPIMVREGRVKYAVSAGQYRTLIRDAETPFFSQGTLIYGLPYDSTLYGGLTIARNYHAQVAGVGHGFGTLGSVSADVTQAHAELADGSIRHGQSYRLQYAKSIEETSTTFTLAGYRYSTGGYYDFREVNETEFYTGSDWRQRYNKRSKTQISINQPLNDYGNLYLSAWQQDYWGYGGDERNASAGYNVSYNGITYGISYTYSQDPGSIANDQQFAFNVQIPLNRWLSDSWATYSMNTGKNGRTSQQAGVSGTALADNNLSYSVQQSYANQGAGASGNANASYKGTYGVAEAGYSYSRNVQQVNYGLQGGIVAHPYGVTFGQQPGDTVALIRAPGASDVRVINNTGVRTDWRGYAIVPYVSTYRKNRIALDTETFADDLDIDTNTQAVIPTNGALVLADYRTRVGRRVLFRLIHNDQPVPFGADADLRVDSEEKSNQGIVGADGQLYLSGVPENGVLSVQWGKSAVQRCRANFKLGPYARTSSVSTQTLICR